MEFVGSLLKTILLWPLLALIDVPFVQLGTRILKLPRPSFGATYLLILVAGVAAILATLVLSPVLPEENTIADVTTSSVFALLVYGWVFGYFLTNVDGSSIGYWKGTQVFLIATALFGALLIAAAFLLVGVMSVWKT
jgi:hypothetical protein